MDRDVSSAWSESRRAKAEADKLAEALRRARGEWEVLLRARLKESPYATLGAAAGIGFVLGGGLAPGLLRTLTGVGFRIATGVMLQRLLIAPEDQGSMFESD